jgi:hypothetical protein
MKSSISFFSAAVGLLLLAHNVSAESFTSCINNQLICQNACGASSSCVMRCQQQAQDCINRVTRNQGQASPQPYDSGGNNNYNTYSDSYNQPKKVVPSNCIKLDTYSTPGVSYLENLCSANLSVSYCFTEGWFLRCSDRRPGHIGIRANSRQSIKAGEGVMRFAYDFYGNYVNLCQLSPSSCR